MAKKPTGAPVSLGDPLETITEREAETWDRVEELRSQVGDGSATVKLMRRGKNGGMEYAETIGLEDFSEQYIKENWGGGVYSCHFYVPQDGRTKYHSAVTVRIAGAPKEKTDAPPAAALGTTATDPNVIALTIELATLKGMVAGMQQAQGNGGGSALDNLEKLTAIVRNLMPAPNPGQDPTAILSFAREAVGFAREMAPEPGGGEASPWDKLIEKGIEPAIDIIRDAMAKSGAGALPLAALPAPQPNPPAVPAGVPMWQAKVMQNVPAILQQLASGRDAGDVAHEFLGAMPVMYYDQLADLAVSETFVATVLALAEQYFPAVTPQRAQVEAFLTAARDELLGEDEPPAGEPEPAPAAPVLMVDAKSEKKKGKAKVTDGE